MKRATAILLAVIIVLTIPTTAFAATTALEILPDLVFNGTTATCEVTVLGDNTTDYIEVTMKLWRGSTCLNTWTDDGYGYVFMSKSANVTKGQTYKLTIDVIFNGVAKPRITIDGTC